MTSRTAYASPERASTEELRLQVGKVRSEKRIAAALDGVGEMTAVLNRYRQVVYANRAFLDYVSVSDVDEVSGRRAGEILSCLTAGVAPSGCGTGEACALCGATEAVLATQRTGKAATTECRMEVGTGNRRSTLELQVRTTPFEIGGEAFTLLSFTDVSHQKRRAALERVFFHDILNTASGLKAYVDLLKATATDPGSKPLIARLDSICATLVEEIEGQKVLVSAENRTLTVRADLIESIALVQELVAMYEGQDMAKGKALRVAPFSEGAAFISDDALVKRILGNMVKNALEASPVGSTVTVGCERAAGTRGGVRFRVHNEMAMAPTVQRQIFHRYFSTKGPDRGLGTWGMKLLAEQYLGAEVAFVSADGKGTEFSLWLPERPSGFGKTTEA
jgi:signal transduction histidine kinase